jgi:hypothetical protein
MNIFQFFPFFSFSLSHSLEKKIYFFFSLSANIIRLQNDHFRLYFLALFFFICPNMKQMLIDSTCLFVVTVSIYQIFPLLLPIILPVCLNEGLRVNKFLRNVVWDKRRDTNIYPISHFCYL